MNAESEHQTNHTAPARVMVWITDLIFETKIRSTGQALGVAVSCVRSMASLAAELNREATKLVIVDLNAAGDPIAAVAAARAHPSNPRVVAYVSHVDADLARRAADAGANEVMPRSKFSGELVRILSDRP